jgi:hypothetical protein
MINIYPVDVQIGNVEIGISKLSNTNVEGAWSGQNNECGAKGAIFGFRYFW